MKIEQIVITPEIAAKMLDKNISNRKLSGDRVLLYSLLMKEGKWFEETAETIKFTNGRLIDGQHRLAAIVKSNVSLKMSVASDLSNDVFKYIDQGKARTASDVFHIEHVENAPGIAATIRFYLIAVKNEYKIFANPNNIKYRPNNAEIFNEYQDRKTYWPERYSRIRQDYYTAAYKLAPPAWLCGWYAILEDFQSSEIVEKFFDLIFYDRKAFITTDLFYDAIMRSKTTQFHRMADSYRNVLFIKTWNSFLEDKPLKVLRYSPTNKEDIPVLLKSATKKKRLYNI